MNNCPYCNNLPISFTKFIFASGVKIICQSCDKLLVSDKKLYLIFYTAIAFVLVGAAVAIIFEFILKWPGILVFIGLFTFMILSLVPMVIYIWKNCGYVKPKT